MITLQPLYLTTGILLAYFGWQQARNRARPHRHRDGLFLGLLSLLFLFGDNLPTWLVGLLVLCLGGLAGLLGAARPGGSRPGDAEARKAGAKRLGNLLFALALLMPLLTLLGVLFLKPLRVHGQPLFEPAGATLLCLGLGCALALFFALLLTGRRLRDALDAGGGLFGELGWTATLPLLLSTLGGVFAAAGVGGALADLLQALLPLHHRSVAVTTYAMGMALLTMIMGNAFAAFPVLTAGIGVPILVRVHHADPAPLAALGMLSGYCGTLLTPMAANFNLVPAALLSLREENAVIKAQAPAALTLLAVNIVLLHLLLFR
jgi:uncharacterized membrane protein